MTSKIAIVLSQERNKDQMYDFSNAIKLAEAFKSYGISFYIVSKDILKDSTFGDAQVYVVPNEVDTLPKMFNWTIQLQKGQKDRQRFLHVVPDSIELLSDPTKLIDAVESMMQHLKLESWLSTACDSMNYVYQKYNPLMKVLLDGDDAVAAGTSQIVFTSHANTSWTCFDLDADIEKLKFNELFTVPMYYIIEFLARRRATSDGLDFMNMYPTVAEEQGVFKTVYAGTKPSDDMLKEEYEKFNNLGLDLTPTSNVDQVLERLYGIISPKDKKKED